MAKHYIARTVTENPGYMQAKIRVPADVTLHAGQVVVAETLDAALGYGNWDVYAPTQVADATKESIAVILDGGFETLADGRRPDGNADYTQYLFNEGDVVTAHRLLPEVRFEISEDACDNTVTAATVVPGDNLIPKNGQYELTYSAKGTTVTTKNYLTVEATKYFRLGGMSGADFAQTMVVRAKATDATA
jgi:hypothetical protein